jgi:SNF2 family DNA or RNA helicase
VHVIKKRDHYTLPPAEVYVITYNKLDAWWGHLARKIRSIIFDEIQELRCTDSAKYLAAKNLCEETPHRLGLTGTPIHNYGDEVWPLYNLIAPDALGTREEFLREWCVTVGNNKHKVSDPVALGQYLRNRHLFLRRTRKDVGREIPAITRIVQEIEFDQKLFSQELGTADELALQILNGSFLERGQAAREFDLRLRQATGLAKAPFVAELVRMLVESGEKVVLSGWHRAVYDIWAERLRDLNPVFFTGHESPAQKEAAKKAFMENKASVFIMSNRSGSGTNGLQYVCSTVIIGELDWCSAVHDQVITRVARDGQDTPVNIYIPVASVGSDPTIADVLGLKSAQSSGIVDLGENPEGDFVDTDPQRIRQLAINFLKSKGIPVSQQQIELSPTEGFADPLPASTAVA